MIFFFLYLTRSSGSLIPNFLLKFDFGSSNTDSVSTGQIVRKALIDGVKNGLVDAKIDSSSIIVNGKPFMKNQYT